MPRTLSRYYPSGPDRRARPDLHHRLSITISSFNSGLCCAPIFSLAGTRDLLQRRRRGPHGAKLPRTDLRNRSLGEGIGKSASGSVGTGSPKVVRSSFVRPFRVPPCPLCLGVVTKLRSKGRPAPIHRSAHRLKCIRCGRRSLRWTIDHPYDRV